MLLIILDHKSVTVRNSSQESDTSVIFIFLEFSPNSQSWVLCQSPVAIPKILNTSLTWATIIETPFIWFFPHQRSSLSHSAIISSQFLHSIYLFFEKTLIPCSQFILPVNMVLVSNERISNTIDLTSFPLISILFQAWSNGAGDLKYEEFDNTWVAADCLLW